MMYQKPQHFLTQNSNSQLTYTKRKESTSNFFQREHNTQINPLEGSADKCKSDNQSNKSTEKRPRRNPHRRKIFEGGSQKCSHIKQSSLSLDRNRNHQHNFENNPIQSKINKNLKNKSRSVYSRQNEQNSFSKVVSASRQTPVIFHYSTPQNNPNYYLPLKSNQVHYVNPTPSPQVHVLPYPAYPMHDPAPNIIRPSSSIPVGPRYPLTYYIPASQYNRPISELTGESPVYNKADAISNMPRMVHYISQSPSASKLQHQNNRNLNFSPFPKDSPKQIISNNKPIVFRSMIMKNEPIQCMKPQKVFKDQKKHFVRQFPNVTPQIHFQKDMKQSFNIQQKFKSSQKENNQNIINSRNSYINHNYREVEPLSDHKKIHDQSDIDIDQVGDLDPIQDEEQKNSDRFFDVDFRKNEVHKSQKYCPVRAPFIEKLSSLNIDKQKIFTHNTPNEEGSHKLQKKTTITSIKLDEQRQRNSIKSQKHIRQNVHNQALQISAFQTMYNQFDRQGRLITLFLVGLGVMLVMLQLIR